MYNKLNKNNKLNTPNTTSNIMDNIKTGLGIGIGTGNGHKIVDNIISTPTTYKQNCDYIIDDINLYKCDIENNSEKCDELFKNFYKCQKNNDNIKLKIT